MKNKKIVKVLRGLPACGKSTLAKNLITDKSWIRINNDDFRNMTFGDRKWNKQDEEFVTQIRLETIKIAIVNNYNIVLDNLNLHPKHIEWLDNTLKEFPDYEMQVVDIQEEPEICIERDKQREKSVGDKVIFDWYHKYVEFKVAPREQDKNLQKCIVVDIDGTVADHEGIRSSYDYSKVSQDRPIQWVIDIIQRYRETHKIIFCSGREDSCYDDTVKWINEYIWNCNEEFEFSACLYTSTTDYILYMRETGDSRKDSIIKKIIYLDHILPKYYVEFVLDDRLSVVRMLRNELGLNVLQCNDGLF